MAFIQYFLSGSDVSVAERVPQLLCKVFQALWSWEISICLNESLARHVYACLIHCDVCTSIEIQEPQTGHSLCKVWVRVGHMFERACRHVGIYQLLQGNSAPVILVVSGRAAKRKFDIHCIDLGMPMQYR